MDRVLRVLQVVPSLSKTAGVARYVYNMQAMTDDLVIHFDYLHHAQSNGILFHENRFDEELQERGSEVYRVTFAGHDFPRFLNETRCLFRSLGQSYDVVHCHMPNVAFHIMRQARINGIRARVLHSHGTLTSDIFHHRMRNALLTPFGIIQATDFAACSQEAGKSLFGKRCFTVFNNGIKIDDYSFEERRNIKYRHELDIPQESIVVGCAGRFVAQKNYQYMVRIFSKLVELEPSAILVIAGDGEERMVIDRMTHEMGIADKVRLPGSVPYMNELYSAFDVFVMPSLFEGLSVASIEAQAAGLRCVFSDDVTREADITGSNVFLSRSDMPENWAKTIISVARDGRVRDSNRILTEKGYSAQENADRLTEFYQSIVLREYPDRIDN